MPVVITFNIDPSKVRFVSPFKVFAVPEPVISLLSALLLIVVDVILLKLLKNAPIPQGSSLEFMGGNKVVLEATDTVTVDSDTNNSVDASLTIMEIT